MHAVVNSRRIVPLADQEPLQLRQHPLLGHPGQDERPPRHAQERPERRLVGAVARDVADDRVHGAVGVADGVEEVAAEHRAGAARAVEHDRVHAAAREQRRGQQAAFQPGGLGGDELLLPQAQQARLRAAALDGVAHGADQQRAVDLALDQVVLGARGDRVGAEVLVVEAGEHADGGERVGREQGAQPVEARVAGQVEVEQHAVGPRRGSGAPRASTRRRSAPAPGRPRRAAPRRGTRHRDRPRPAAAAAPAPVARSDRPSRRRGRSQHGREQGEPVGGRAGEPVDRRARGAASARRPARRPTRRPRCRSASRSGWRPRSGTRPARCPPARPAWRRRRRSGPRRS